MALDVDDLSIDVVSHPAGYNGWMGKNNRQRRAAKVRKRRESGGSPPGGGSRRSTWTPFGPPPEDPWLTPGDRFIVAVRAHQAGDDDAVARLVEHLAGAPRRATAEAIAGHLEDQVAHLWRHGWQPADLDRLVARELSKPEVDLIRSVIGAQSATYHELGAKVAPAWMHQLSRIDAAPVAGHDRAYLLHQGPWPDALLAAVRAMALLTRLPSLPVLLDPPERWVDGPLASGGSLPPSVLDKVRALLAKAESTTFEAEAEAFTAKAQELMARHRIDRAVLDAGRHEGREQPAARRVGVDDPYADAKAMLASGIASANGCRAVWSKELGFTTVFGFPGELDAVEELYTSLLVQATIALRREGSKQDRYGRSRTTRFRRSFLVAFAQRIAHRLTETVAATVDAASEETGTALVPILAARDEAAAAAAEEAFPEVGSFAPTATDGEGWFAGTLFGDQADLAVGPELTPETSVRWSTSPIGTRSGRCSTQTG